MLSDFIRFTWLIIKSYSLSLVQPMFWVVVFLVYLQYRRTAKMEKDILGTVQYPTGERVLDSIFFGLMGGLVGSFIMVLLGVTMDQSGLEYVWPLAILLMLINPRYICFSYAGGIVSLISLVFGYPHINVAGLMALVGILHLIESLLIWIDGHRGRLPIFMERRDGSIVGGFNLQRFWPIPILMLVLYSGPFLNSGTVETPGWWPLIHFPGATASSVFVIMNGMAALGYGDIVLTETPEERSRSSAIGLLGFSIILIVLSVLASKNMVMKYIAALFAPIGHEVLILYGRHVEDNGEPLYVAPERGMRILEVIKGGPAYKMGLKPGDTILNINGESVNNETDLRNFLYNMTSHIYVNSVNPDGVTRTSEYTDHEGISHLGILFVPKNKPPAFTVAEAPSLLSRIFNSITHKLGHH